MPTLGTSNWLPTSLPTPVNILYLLGSVYLTRLGDYSDEVTESTPKTSRESELVFETLNVRNEGAVLFVEISAPPMNLNGPELVRDLVSLIQQAEADEAVQVLVFKSADPDYFISHVDVTRIKENRGGEAER